MRSVAPLFLLALCQLSDVAHAWSACGHHIVCRLAFQELNESEQDALLELLTHHPRYKEDFRLPSSVRNARLWIVGRAGEWPDIARSQPEFDRPNWHYQLGANLIIGDESKLDIPKSPGPLPDDASMQTEDLHILQAIELNRRILGDWRASKANRALAICWLGHLVGDLHQPCHAGSLYAEGVFPQGDRGANSIKTMQQGNLHRLWDRLLGGRFDEADVRRREHEVRRLIKERFTERNNQSWIQSSPETWAEGSREYAVRIVYSGEVLAHVRALQHAKDSDLPALKLSDSYLAAAAETARGSVYIAGRRLGYIWRDALPE